MGREIPPPGGGDDNNVNSNRGYVSRDYSDKEIVGSHTEKLVNAGVSKELESVEEIDIPTESHPSEAPQVDQNKLDWLVDNNIEIADDPETKIEEPEVEKLKVEEPKVEDSKSPEPEPQP